MSNHRLLNERIAVLETKQGELEKDLLQAYADIREHMDREEEDREVLISKISTLQSELFEVQKTLVGWKGTLGGIILTVSGIFTALGLVWKFLIN